VRIRVKVVPNSKVEQITCEDDEFLVKVKEPPREGRANKAVIKLVAKHFKVSQDSIIIVSGFTNRNKVIEVLGK